MKTPTDQPEISPEEKDFITQFSLAHSIEHARKTTPERDPTAEEINAITERIQTMMEVAVINLQQAKIAGAHMHMEGDHGGQIYLTIPAQQVGCDEATLKKLLKEIDAREWQGNEGIGGSVQYTRNAKKEEGISGGMGGGEVTDGLWVHETLKDMEPLIRVVLMGTRSEVTSPTSPELRERDAFEKAIHLGRQLRSMKVDPETKKAAAELCGKNFSRDDIAMIGIGCEQALDAIGRAMQGLTAEDEGAESAPWWIVHSREELESVIFFLAAALQSAEPGSEMAECLEAQRNWAIREIGAIDLWVGQHIDKLTDAIQSHPDPDKETREAIEEWFEKLSRTESPDEK